MLKILHNCFKHPKYMSKKLTTCISLTTQRKLKIFSDERRKKNINKLKCCVLPSSACASGV